MIAVYKFIFRGVKDLCLEARSLQWRTKNKEGLSCYTVLVFFQKARNNVAQTVSFLWFACHILR